MVLYRLNLQLIASTCCSSHEGNKKILLLQIGTKTSTNRKMTSQEDREIEEVLKGVKVTAASQGASLQ
jgi:hypothetical protein